MVVKKKNRQQKIAQFIALAMVIVFTLIIFAAFRL